MAARGEAGGASGAEHRKATGPKDMKDEDQKRPALWAADVFLLANVFMAVFFRKQKPYPCKDGLTGNCSEQRARKRSDADLSLLP